MEISIGNKIKLNKIDFLQIKIKGRYKFVLLVLKFVKVKIDVKFKNENEDVYESGNDNGVNKNGFKGKMGGICIGKIDNKDIIESIKIDEKKFIRGEVIFKSILKVIFEIEENYFTESEVNGSYQIKYQSNIKNIQYGKEVKYFSGLLK